jgi:transposase
MRKAPVVMESGYNHEHIYDLLKGEGYDVKVAHPLMVKAIAYAKIKNDKVDARMLADLLRSGMIPECYIPNIETRVIRETWLGGDKRAREREKIVNSV